MLDHFPIFHFYPLSQKISTNEVKVSQMSSLSEKLQSFFPTKCLRHFHEKKSFQFVSFFFLEFGLGLEIHGSFKRQC